LAVTSHRVGALGGFVGGPALDFHFRAFRKFLKGPVKYGDKSSAMHLSVQDGATIDGVMEALQGMKAEADGPLS
jgi:hypothetical protein